MEEMKTSQEIEKQALVTSGQNEELEELDWKKKIAERMGLEPRARRCRTHTHAFL